MWHPVVGQWELHRFPWYPGLDKMVLCYSSSVSCSFCRHDRLQFSHGMSACQLVVLLVL